MSTQRHAPGEAHRTVAVHVVSEPVAEPVGRLVARRYRLKAVLGRGGMARVWLADDELLHRPVALKQILLDGLEAAEMRAAAWTVALSEARATGRVDHVGAVRVYDLVADDRCPWIVMEPLSGRTLRETLHTAGALPIDEVTRVGLCLLDVLQATHRAGIVHLDVKPSNVHLCEDARVVLTDFGVACAIDDATTTTATFAGSPAYVAPERVDSAEFGPASDMFSLGATLFAAVEGVPPFYRNSVHATFTAVVEDPRRHSGAPARCARSSKGSSPRTPTDACAPTKPAPR
jgi:serine/threonine protein kinase